MATHPCRVKLNNDAPTLWCVPLKGRRDATTDNEVATIVTTPLIYVVSEFLSHQG
ncbi:hypothetical protein D3C71_1909920 [compost metagenome]|jgi:hypothetical protein